MNILSEKTAEAIYLADPENLSVVYVHKIDGFKPIRFWNRVGGSALMHCVGAGKAIMAAIYTQLRETIKHSVVKCIDKTLASIKPLDADVELINQRGYAIDRGEFRERILISGIVVRLPDEGVVAALRISLPNVKLAVKGEIE